MKILYFGHVSPKKIVKKSSAVSIAGNNLEIGMLEELTKIYDKNLSIFSVLPFASFPKSSNVFVKKEEYFENNISIKTIPFVNILFFKQIMIMLSVTLIILKELLTSKEKLAVMTYNAPTIYALPIMFISKVLRLKILKICLVVDIPIMFQKKKGIREFARILENNFGLKLFKKYDGMITLVENTVTNFTDLDKYLVINYSPAKTISSGTNKIKLDTNKINLTFTGAVEEYYGIKEMIHSMKYLGSEYRLNIFGSGTLDDYVKDQSLMDERIIHHGRVAHDVSIDAQIQSDLLLLVRTDKLLNKFGLPSKVIEYLSSGTPVITNKIESVPSELYKYLNTYNEITGKSISDKVKHVLSDQEYKIRKNKADLAKEFISVNYNWEIQSKKMQEFICELNKEVKN